MKKKLLTLAVAAAMAAPGIASAEAIMYGKLNMSIDYFDIKTNVYAGPEGNVLIEQEGFKGWTLNGRNGAGESRANRLGVKGSEDLGNGLKAIYQIEFGVRMANEADNDLNNGDADSAVTMRNSFVGLAGGWGTLLVGRHDTPMKISSAKLDLFADTIADYNGTVGFVDVRADNAIAYISPSWAGLQFAGAVVPGGGSTVGGDYNVQSDSIAEGYSLALIYSNGPFYASAAYEAFSKQLGARNVTTGTNGDLFASQNLLSPGEGLLYDHTTGDLLNPVDGYVVVADPAGAYVDVNGNHYNIQPAPGITTALVSPNDDWSHWRLGLGLLDWNGFTLTAIYEKDSNYNWGPNDPDMWQVQAGYAFGNMMLKGMYGQFSNDIKYEGYSQVANNVRTFLEDKSLDTWAVGADYNFSKRTKAYMVYSSVTDDRPLQQNWDGFSLGMMHSF
jgi:predicted porin